MLKRILFAVVLMAIISGLAVCPGTSRAEMVTFYYSGIITQVINLNPELDGVFREGSLFTGSYTFDASRPNLGDSTQGLYWFDKTPESFFMKTTVASEAGQFVFQNNPSTEAFTYINVWNDSPRYPGDPFAPVIDRYSVETEQVICSGPIAAMEKYELINMNLILESAFQDRISGTELPGVPPDFNLFEVKPSFDIRARWDGSEHFTYLRGDLTYFSTQPQQNVVPLPASIWLFGSGLTVAGFRRGWRHPGKQGT